MGILRLIVGIMAYALIVIIHVIIVKTIVIWISVTIVFSTCNLWNRRAASTALDVLRTVIRGRIDFISKFTAYSLLVVFIAIGFEEVIAWIALYLAICTFPIFYGISQYFYIILSLTFTIHLNLLWLRKFWFRNLLRRRRRFSFILRTSIHVSLSTLN